jgi:hypothetical protein
LIIIPQEENWEHIRARIVMDIQDDYLADPSKDKAYLDSLSSPQEQEDFLAQHTKFMIRHNNTEEHGKTEHKEILTYQQIMDFLLDDDQKSERVWKFQRIVAHEGP